MAAVFAQGLDQHRSDNIVVPHGCFRRQNTEESMSTTCSRGASVLRVKNTFIDVLWDSDEFDSEDDAPAMVPTKSCPALAFAAGTPRTASGRRDGSESWEGSQAGLGTTQAEGSDEEKVAVSTTSGTGAPILRVKNTFIEALWRSDGSESEGDEPSVVPTKSCPALSFAPHAEPAPTMSTWRMCDGGESWDGLQTGCWADEDCSDDDEATTHSPRECLVLKPHVVPLHFRQPEVSVGSALHASGGCKPCAWLWRPQGCDNGAECRHCHVCGADELKARRHSKKTVARRRLRGRGNARRGRGSGPEAPQ